MQFFLWFISIKFNLGKMYYKSFLTDRFKLQILLIMSCTMVIGLIGQWSRSTNNALSQITDKLYHTKFFFIPIMCCFVFLCLFIYFVSYENKIDLDIYIFDKQNWIHHWNRVYPSQSYPPPFFPCRKYLTHLYEILLTNAHVQSVW